MSERVIRKVIVHGRVQGVGFRVWTEHMAGMRGLEGFVRNRRDGAVEAVFAGPAEAVRAMVELCRQGPAGARVDAVDEREAGPELLAERYSGEGFSVLPTR